MRFAAMAAASAVGLGVEDVASERRRVAGLGEALLDQLGDLAAVDRLVLEQRLGDQLEAAAVLGDQLGGPLLLLGEDAGDLLVEQLGGVVAVLAAARHQVLAEEHLLLAAPRHRADAVAHAPLADHPAGDAGGLLEVVGGAGVEVVEHDLLGDAAAHRLADGVLEVLLGVGVALLRQAPRDAEGHAARQDRDLVQRVAVGQHGGQQGVAALVVGGGPLLLGAT